MLRKPVQLQYQQSFQTKLKFNYPKNNKNTVIIVDATSVIIASEPNLERFHNVTVW